MDLHPLADLAAVICDKRGLDSLGVADDASLIQATAKVGADKIIVADLTDEDPQLVQCQRLLPFEHQAATALPEKGAGLGVTLDQALVWNVGTSRLDDKGEIQGEDP